VAACPLPQELSVQDGLLASCICCRILSQQLRAEVCAARRLLLLLLLVQQLLLVLVPREVLPQLPLVRLQVLLQVLLQQQAARRNGN
jgi:hypothetical protein